MAGDKCQTTEFNPMARYFRTGSFSTQGKQSEWLDVKDVVRIEGKDVNKLSKSYLEVWRKARVYFTLYCPHLAYGQPCEYDYPGSGYVVDRRCDDLVEILHEKIADAQETIAALVKEIKIEEETILDLNTSIELLNKQAKNDSTYSVSVLIKKLDDCHGTLYTLQQRHLASAATLKTLQEKLERFKKLSNGQTLSSMQSEEMKKRFSSGYRKRPLLNTLDGGEFLVRGHHGGNGFGSDYVVRAYCKEQILEYEASVQYGHNHFTIVIDRIYPIQVVNVDSCDEFQVVVQRAIKETVAAEKQAIEAEKQALDKRLAQLQCSTAHS